jgi:hypothetical protein
VSADNGTAREDLVDARRPAPLTEDFLVGDDDEPVGPGSESLLRGGPARATNGRACRSARSGTSHALDAAHFVEGEQVRQAGELRWDPTRAPRASWPSRALASSSTIGRKRPSPRELRTRARAALTASLPLNAEMHALAAGVASGAAIVSVRSSSTRGARAINARSSACDA